MFHPIAYTMIATVLSGFAFAGAPVPSSIAIIIAAIAISAVGVPHGGLDHWVGRRLLTPRFGRRWAVAFLPAYLMCGSLVAIAWFTLPMPTIVVFFLISAWHFGREDGLGHFEAPAVGGLIIWIPALARPVEMETIVNSLIVESAASKASTIVNTTQIVAVALIPIAAWSIVFGKSRQHRLVGFATTVLALATPILCSFTLFFCGWHSFRGLVRMREEENLDWGPFFRAVLPLSFGAIALVMTAGFWLGGALGEPTTQMRMLFIGLASIAVPHLFLHEIENALSFDRNPRRVGEIVHAS
jgi:Brp/Blh family beta-carotene 15,15'-monooxygenase